MESDQDNVVQGAVFFPLHHYTYPPYPEETSSQLPTSAEYIAGHTTWLRQH